VVCSIAAAQQAHVHRTQNAGQPLSGADSFVPIGHVSGTRNALKPLASARHREHGNEQHPTHVCPILPARFQGPGPGLSPFDSFEPVQHSREVVGVIRRAAAIVAVLTLAVGNVAQCAGWQATPEARMACCMDGATCPMHKSDSHKSSSSRVVSQAQADSCCAAATQGRDSSAAGSIFAISSVMALVPVTAFTVPSNAFASQEWRALVPLPVSSTPKHLLLSVFLV
jgi:hypothetical protein